MRDVADRPGLLVLRGVVKAWGDRRVLDGIDLTLEPGQLVRILGANGAGKTTLLRVATGMIRPDGGDVALRGLHPERDRARFLSGVGFLSAGDGGLYARLSSRRHLELCADLSLIPRPRRSEAIAEAIDAFELAGFLDRRVQRISTGQRQRTRLALAFLHHPDVVLLDEPGNSLDDDGLALLDRHLGALRLRGGACLWCAPSAGDSAFDFDARYRLSGGGLRPE
jgi:ABC-2 type transport system ATP-binding protein